MLFSSLVITTLCYLTAAAPTAINKRWPVADGTFITPSVISIYHGQNGAIEYNTAKGEVSREQWNGKDNSTLVTFDINGKTLGTTCSLRFFQDSADTSAIFTGYPAQVDIFRSLQPAPVSGSTGWGGPGNQRDIPLGRFEPRYNGNAVVVENVGPGLLNSFPCPRIGDYNVKNGLVGFEIVPVGDRVRVEWTAALSGLYLDW
jgi:hypothetical protein